MSLIKRIKINFECEILKRGGWHTYVPFAPPPLGFAPGEDLEERVE